MRLSVDDEPKNDEGDHNDADDDDADGGGGGGGGDDDDGDGDSSGLNAQTRCDFVTNHNLVPVLDWYRKFTQQQRR